MEYKDLINFIDGFVESNNLKSPSATVSVSINFPTECVTFTADEIVEKLGDFWAQKALQTVSWDSVVPGMVHDHTSVRSAHFCSTHISMSVNVDDAETKIESLSLPSSFTL